MKKEFTSKFHDGDKVIMVNCLEADSNKGKEWTCRGARSKRVAGTRSFSCKAIGATLTLNV